MNLKKLLMELGNYLVHEGFDPPITMLVQFTEWLNQTPAARAWLALQGVAFPVVKKLGETFPVVPQVVGFWVVDTTDGELIKWGKQGSPIQEDTGFPYGTEVEALDQAAFLQQQNADAKLWLLKVFSNGQIRTIEYIPEEHCPTCGTPWRTAMESNRANRQDKSLTERKYCPKCEGKK